MSISIGKFYMQLQKLRCHFTVHSAVWITGEFKMKYGSRSAKAFTWLAPGVAVVNLRLEMRQGK